MTSTPEAEPSVWRDRIRRAVASVVAITALVGAATLLGDDGAASTKGHWTFLDTASLAELGLVAHDERGGVWGLEDHETATGGRALANQRGEAGASPAVLVAIEPRARDVRALTRCKIAPAGNAAVTAASCGVVFRFVDVRNYWIVRADATASSIDVATVSGGRERVARQFSLPEALRVGEWIELGIEARGDMVKVTLDGRAALIAEAATVPAASGAVGLWAPADATVFFDHFTIETLTATPRALEILPLLGKRPGAG